MKTFLWIDTDYVAYDFLVSNAESLQLARESLTNQIRVNLALELANCQRADQENWRSHLKMKYEGWIMYINKELPTILENNESAIYKHLNQ